MIKVLWHRLVKSKSSNRFAPVYIKFRMHKVLESGCGRHTHCLCGLHSPILDGMSTNDGGGDDVQES